MPSPSTRQSIDPSRRSLTWPTTMIHVAPSFSRGTPRTYMSSPGLRPSPPALTSATPARPQKKPACDSFENELDEHPDAHFLSPVQMYEYEDWASDSDDDEVAWDAGITDFALFDSDRRRAQERQEVMPNHWENLLTSQAMALQRAVERNRADPDSSDIGKTCTPTLEDVPLLTPDSSPNLRDQLDMESHFTRPSHVPDYLSSRVAPSNASYDEDLDDSVSDLDDEDDDDEDDDDDDDDYDTPIAVLLARARERQRQYRRLDRPGLRYSRTMSGKVHVWRRPSLHIYPVGEDVEAERKAEMLALAEEAERGMS